MLQLWVIVEIISPYQDRGALSLLVWSLLHKTAQVTRTLYVNEGCHLFKPVLVLLQILDVYVKIKPVLVSLQIQDGSVKINV